MYMYAWLYLVRHQIMGMLKMWCWRNIIRWYKRWQWSQSHQIVCTSVHKMQMIGYILGRHRMLWQYNRLIGHFRRICIGRLFLVRLFWPRRSWFQMNALNMLTYFILSPTWMGTKITLIGSFLTMNCCHMTFHFVFSAKACVTQLTTKWFFLVMYISNVPCQSVLFWASIFTEFTLKW